MDLSVFLGMIKLQVLTQMENRFALAFQDQDQSVRGMSFNISHLESKRYMFISKKNEYNVQLVDMEEYGGYGECSCEYWQFVIGPQLKRGNKPKKKCRHLKIMEELIQEHSPKSSD